MELNIKTALLQIKIAKTFTFAAAWNQKNLHTLRPKNLKAVPR